MTKDYHDKELKWKYCLFCNRCPILDLNNGLFSNCSQYVGIDTPTPEGAFLIKIIYIKMWTMVPFKEGSKLNKEIT